MKGRQESHGVTASMKVSGTSGAGQAGAARPGRAAAAGENFRIPGLGQAAGPAQLARATGVAGVSSVDALLALQDVGGPLERRRRAVGRAGRILDELDKMKVSLLEGGLGPHDLELLRRAVREERSNTDDPRLEAVLDEIETRAAVELAKLERASHAA